MADETQREEAQGEPLAPTREATRAALWARLPSHTQEHWEAGRRSKLQQNEISKKKKL